MVRVSSTIIFIHFEYITDEAISSVDVLSAEQNLRTLTTSLEEPVASCPANLGSVVCIVRNRRIYDRSLESETTRDVMHRSCNIIS